MRIYPFKSLFPTQREDAPSIHPDNPNRFSVCIEFYFTFESFGFLTGEISIVFFYSSLNTIDPYSRGNIVKEPTHAHA